jgi:DNA helicase-4
MPDIPISLIYRIVTFRWRYSVEISKAAVRCPGRGNADNLHYGNVQYKPKISSGILWDNIVFLNDDGLLFVIHGVKKNSSEESLKELIEKISKYCIEIVEPSYQKMKFSYSDFKNIFGKRYIRHSSVEGWKEGNKEIAKHLANQFAIDFLPQNKIKTINNYLTLLSKSHKIRETRNKYFISRELSSYQEYFDNVENNPLTESQRLACVVNEDSTLVLAGAGSGKTSVIIAKAGYLIKSGLAEPHEILILAYGRKASAETDERIKAKLQDVEGITTSTFHKLGLDIIGNVTGKKPRVSKLQEDTAEFYKLINNFIAELTKNDRYYNQRVIDYFVNFLIPYKNEFDYEVQGDYFAALKEGDLESIKSKFAKAEKQKGRTSLQQEHLKSFEEVVIADFLFVNGIKYIYEHPYKVDTATSQHSQYQPDFYLPDHDLYIEHLGLSRNGETAPFVDRDIYMQGVEWKRNLHRLYSTKLVETYSYEMKEGVLTDRLYSKLRGYGVKFNPLSYEKLLELLFSINEEKKATQFTKVIVAFLNLFKQSGYSMSAVRDKADRHFEKPRCHAFLDVFEPIFTEYTNELNRSRSVDFSDMIRTATNIVQQGQYRSPYKYILVDEFQDISAIRADLVKSLVASGDDTVLSCVGDDWQSIYRFAGSDINYTGKFEDCFGFTEKVQLDMTFRFNDKINAFSTTFITQNPAQIKKDVSSNTIVSSNAVTLVEYHKDVDAAIEKCVEDIRENHSKSGTIYILGRYLFSKPASLQTIAAQYPAYTFIFDTVHASKGKEADFVIVVDVNDAKYGFPSKIVDEPLLDLVLPPAEPHAHAEERRLFYVAITRSKHHAYILYDTVKPSVFISEIRDEKGAEYHFNRIFTEGVESAPQDYGKCPVCGTGKVTMRVMPDSRFFFGCGHYPFCNYTPRTCNVCNKFPLSRDGNQYRCENPECGNVVKGCKQCKDGVMVERYGQYGKFLGCSNYNKRNCRYTERC